MKFDIREDVKKIIDQVNKESEEKWGKDLISVWFEKIKSIFKKKEN